MERKTITISPDGFLHMLINQNGGALIEELDREMAKGIGAVLDHGGMASVGLSIKFARIVGMDKGMTIKHDVKTNFPKEPRLDSAMFVSDGNGLLIQPQEQATMVLEQALVDQSTGEVLEKSSVSLINSLTKS